MIWKQRISSANATAPENCVNPNGGNDVWPGEFATIASVHFLQKSSPWTISYPSPAAEKAPKAMLCPAAKNATMPKSNSFPWNGNPISKNSTHKHLIEDLKQPLSCLKFCASKPIYLKLEDHILSVQTSFFSM